MSRPTCRGCGAVVRWITTVAGRAMICDPDKLQEWLDTDAPSTATPRLTLITAEGKMVTGQHGSVLTPGARSIEGYVPHWATCPKAKAFKR